MGIAGTLYSQSRPNDWDGPPVQVKVDSTSLCVGRRFIEPNDLVMMRNNGGPVTAGPLHRRAVPIALFSEALTGYTDDHYRTGIATVYDKRKYPSDWIRIEILPKEMRRPIGIPPKDYQHAFEESWAIDAGFRTHRRRQDCVGQSVQWAALSAVTLGPDCLDGELRYGNSAAPQVVLYCNKNRCYTSNYLEHSGVSFEYDFPKCGHRCERVGIPPA